MNKKAFQEDAYRRLVDPCVQEECSGCVCVCVCPGGVVSKGVCVQRMCVQGVCVSIGMCFQGVCV